MNQTPGRYNRTPRSEPNRLRCVRHWPRPVKAGQAWLALLLAAAMQAQPTALIIPGLETAVDGVEVGEILLGELNCLACHRADRAVRTHLAPKQAPLLGEIGARMKPDFLPRYLANPHAEKPGTTMPDVLHALPATEKQSTAEALSQFLLSLASDVPTDSAGTNRLALEQGRVLYHCTGCVACHPPQEAAAAVFPDFSGGGPTDAEAVRYVLENLNRLSVPLGKLEEKYRVAGLEHFLRAPLTTRPSGRMPSLNLTTNESHAIACYLVRAAPPSAASQAPSYEPSMGRVALPARPPEGVGSGGRLGEASLPESVPKLLEKKPPAFLDRRNLNRGKQLFAELGCAACHALGPGQPRIASRLVAKPLDQLDAAAVGGCLDPQPKPGVARFLFSDAERAALRTTLGRRALLALPLSPADQVRHATVRFDCLGCHSRGGVGGPSPSRADYFTNLGHADLGDEGRLPPHLNETGRKLRPAWLREVLLNRGAVRPYMATRMPQFGAANVEPLVAAFGQADAPPTGPAPRDNSVRGDPTAGRLLVGTNGCACISCHNFGPFKSQGIAVMDMTCMARRLNREWFRRYLVDPQSLRPGTRMPSFWPDGQATVPTILDGNTVRQIEAIWTYLSEVKTIGSHLNN